MSDGSDDCENIFSDQYFSISKGKKSSSRTEINDSTFVISTDTVISDQEIVSCNLRKQCERQRTLDAQEDQLHLSFFPTQDPWVADFLTNQTSEKSSSNRKVIASSVSDSPCLASSSSTMRKPKKPSSHVLSDDSSSTSSLPGETLNIPASENPVEDTIFTDKLTACSSNFKKSQDCFAKHLKCSSRSFFSSPEPCSTNVSKENVAPKSSSRDVCDKDNAKTTVASSSSKFQDFHSKFKRKFEQLHSSFLPETNCSAKDTCSSHTQKSVKFIEENVSKIPTKNILDSLPLKRHKSMKTNRSGASFLKNSEELSSDGNLEADLSTVKSKFLQSRTMRDEHFFIWLSPRSRNARNALLDEGIKAAEEWKREQQPLPPSITKTSKPITSSLSTVSSQSRENCFKLPNLTVSNFRRIGPQTGSEIPAKKSKSEEEREESVSNRNSSTDPKEPENIPSAVRKIDHHKDPKSKPTSQSDDCEIPFLTIKKPRLEIQTANRTIVRLFIVDLLRLTPTARRNYYMFHGLTVHLVDVFGVITGVRPVGFNKMLYQVDDGSGTLDCLHPKAKEEANMKCLKEHLDLDQSEGDEMSSNLTTSSMSESTVEGDSEYDEALKGFRTFMIDGFAKCLEDQEYKIGDTVHAFGFLYDFHGTKTMYIYNIRKVFDLSEETDRLLQMAILYRKDYPKTVPGFTTSKIGHGF